MTGFKIADGERLGPYDTVWIDRDDVLRKLDRANPPTSPSTTFMLPPWAKFSSKGMVSFTDADEAAYPYK